MQIKKILLWAVLPILICPFRLGAESPSGIRASVEKGKVLLDIPDSLLGRTWAMASTIRTDGQGETLNPQEESIIIAGPPMSKAITGRPAAMASWTTHPPDSKSQGCNRTEHSAIFFHAS